MISEANRETIDLIFSQILAKKAQLEALDNKGIAMEQTKRMRSQTWRFTILILSNELLPYSPSATKNKQPLRSLQPLVQKQTANNSQQQVPQSSEEHSELAGTANTRLTYTFHSRIFYVTNAATLFLFFR